MGISFFERIACASEASAGAGAGELCGMSLQPES
jgi:hypothetical protein